MICSSSSVLAGVQAVQKHYECLWESDYKFSGFIRKDYLVFKDMAFSQSQNPFDTCKKKKKQLTCVLYSNQKSM